MSVKFLSKDWENGMIEGLQEEFQKKGGVTTDFLQVANNCPDGKTRWMLLELEKSIFKSYEVGEGELPDAKFIAMADYATFIDVIEGRLDGKKALLTGQFQLEGNMTKALSLMGAYGKLEKVQRSIDTEF